MKNSILVGTGGMLGAGLRYTIMITIPDILFLWGINGVGSFILGWLAGRANATGKASSLLWTTGVLGSFTTFSTFSAEWLILLEENIIFSSMYGVGMTLFCFMAAAIGLQLGGKFK